MKKYVIIFGTLFNDIRIFRKDEDGIAQTLKVPLMYGPKEKALSRIDVEPGEIDRDVAIRLPRITFEVISMTYGATRKLNTLNKIYSTEAKIGTGTYQKVFEPVPYDINFQVNVMTKTVEDGNQILEQILPYFTPEWTITAELLKDELPNVTRDIPIILNSAISDDSYEGDYESRRVLTWTLDFLMKVYFYGPTNEAKIIKFISIDVFAGENIDASGENITIKPGLTANGEPTSNSAQSISHILIDEDDDYGFIVTIEGITQ